MLRSVLIVATQAALVACATTNVDWAIPTTPDSISVSVGDTVAFTWSGYHDVYESAKTSPSCDEAGGTSLASASSGGSHSITYTAAGTYYYICTVGTHCESGQILTVTVTSAGGGPTTSPSPSPPPPSPSPPPPVQGAPSPPSPSPPASIASPAPTPPPGEDPCFPSTAAVTLAGGARVAIDGLREGDAIVAATADGALTTDVVSSLSIAKPEATASFVALTTANGTARLTLTPEHHVPVGGACCATLKKAKDVEVGETIFVVGRAKGGATAHTVATKAMTTGTGLHSPVLTHGSFPVVDDVVTAFDRIESVTLASYLLPYAEPVLAAVMRRFA